MGGVEGPEPHAVLRPHLGIQPTVVSQSNVATFHQDVTASSQFNEAFSWQKSAVHAIIVGRERTDNWAPLLATAGRYGADLVRAGLETARREVIKARCKTVEVVVTNITRASGR